MMEREEWKPLENYYYETGISTEKEPFLFRISRAGCTSCGKDFCIDRKEQYPYYTVHILLDGYGMFRIQNKSYFLKKGDAFLITPGQAHMYSNYSSSELVLLWLEVSGGSCKELFGYFQSREMYAIQKESTDKAARLLLEILDYLKAGGSTHVYECSAKVYSFFMYLHEAARNLPLDSRPDPLEQALAHIDGNFTSSIKIQELAKSIHISHTYLNRLFIKGIGMSPKRYILMKRMEYACYLLETTGLSSEEISERIGMYDNACFYRSFKSVMGITPVAYRKKQESRRIQT